MSKRRFNLPKNNNAVSACPKCKNKISFVAVSEQVAEDMCEVWIECSCGHDPHKSNERLESIMGELSESNIRMALDCWNACAAVRKTSGSPTA